jgi:hypothetical protein
MLAMVAAALAVYAGQGVKKESAPNTGVASRTATDRDTEEMAGQSSAANGEENAKSDSSEPQGMNRDGSPPSAPTVSTNAPEASPSGSKAPANEPEAPETKSGQSSTEITEKGSPVGGKTESGEVAKQAIRQEYAVRLQALQSVCQGKVNQLVGGISVMLDQAQNSGQPVPVDQIKDTYLKKASQEESECDNDFMNVYKQAEKAYLDAGFDPAELEGWKQQYANEKNQARARALNEIIAHVSSRNKQAQ